MNIHSTIRWAVWRNTVEPDRFEAIDVSALDLGMAPLPSPPGAGWDMRLITYAPTAAKAIADTRSLDDAGMLDPTAPWGDVMERCVSLDGMLSLVPSAPSH
ncbi:hypothetical protein [Noviherbaspirillum galbum]|uniref:Uncharacterized protein n=1 Tax=Noviherbaspirillum galbum TaxID=2709383 RepID=A0A6B3SNU0_9BURK|nr:hypothetical protein [Noviherbaspirillum galbum]NEX60132.1 hypothetical protein [Noviherbaspirillum galbum]